jgi:hypothetical protein
MAIVLDGNNLLTTGVLNSMTAQTTVGGTAYDFTGIPAGVRRITVVMFGVSTSGSTIPIVQLGTSGGIVTSGYLTAGSFTASGGYGAANYTNGLPFGANGNASHIRHGLLTMLNAGSNNWVSSGTLGLSNSTETGSGGGSIALSGVVTTVRITTVNGTDTFDAGSINVYYE